MQAHTCLVFPVILPWLSTLTLINEGSYSIVCLYVDIYITVHDNRLCRVLWRRANLALQTPYKACNLIFDPRKPINNTILFLFHFRALGNEMSCATNIGCVILAGIMTWLEGSSIVRNLAQVG